jgi:hypothetical protein
VEWIDDFASSAAEQLERQLPATFRVEVLESGFIVRISRGPRWVVVHTGAILTNEWRPLPASRLEQAETTVLALLNHVGDIASDHPGETEVRELIEGLHAHVEGDKVHGQLGSLPLRVQITIAVPPGTPVSIA